MSRRKEIAIDDCGNCKESLTDLERQSMACGYLPRTDRVHLTIWQPPSGGKYGYSGPALTVCAGYTANLPEVVEACFAHAHWAHGNVAMDRTPERLLRAILIVDGQRSQVEAWRMTPRSEGGGGA